VDGRVIPSDDPVAPRAWAGLAVVAAASFVVSLDAMVLYVAFGDLRRDFSPFPDPVGMIFITIALVLLALGIVQSDEWGWSSSRTLGVLLAGVLALCAFVVRCVTVVNPVLALDLFSERGFRWANLGQLLYGTGFTIIERDRRVTVPRATTSRPSTIVAGEPAMACMRRAGAGVSS
jgi:hypothetical protein